MNSEIARSSEWGRIGRRGVPVAALLLLGWGWLVARPSEVTGERAGLTQVAAADQALGRGTVLAALAGFRGVLADVVWLQAYLAWERSDVALTEERLQRVTALDERPLYFWLNGARMIAFDVPVWRREAAGVSETSTLGRAITRQQAERALAYLAAARRAHPTEPLIVVEMAGIRFNGLGDLDGAAALYREAAEMPGAPYFAARLHAELLRRAGRLREARDWLVALRPTLPRVNRPPAGVNPGSRAYQAWLLAVEQARAEEVDARIHALDGEIEAATK